MVNGWSTCRAVTGHRQSIDGALGRPQTGANGGGRRRPTEGFGRRREASGRRSQRRRGVGRRPHGAPRCCSTNSRSDSTWKAATAAVELIYGPVAAAPHPGGQAAAVRPRGLYSARRGDFRIIYRITDVVAIVAIDHRADIFRPR